MKESLEEFVKAPGTSLWVHFATKVFREVQENPYYIIDWVLKEASRSTKLNEAAFWLSMKMELSIP